MTDKSDDRRDRLAARFIAGLSKESLAYGRRCEYVKGYPGASEAEIDLLMAAERKNGSVPWNMVHAKEIMARDNIYAFRPCSAPPFGRAGIEWRQPHPSAAVIAEDRENPRPVYTTPLDD
jgi:hypothetical protein